MNIAGLAERVAAHAQQGVDKKPAKGVIEAALKAVVEAVKDGTDVNLAVFGRFEVQDQPEHEGLDPATGKAMMIATSRKLAFTPARVREDTLVGCQRVRRRLQPIHTCSVGPTRPTFSY